MWPCLPNFSHMPWVSYSDKPCVWVRALPRVTLSRIRSLVEARCVPLGMSEEESEPALRALSNEAMAIERKVWATPARTLADVLLRGEMALYNERRCAARAAGLGGDAAGRSRTIRGWVRKAEGQRSGEGRPPSAGP